MTEELLKINLSEKRKRSTIYPSATIPECLDFISIIKKLGGKSVAEEILLKELGLKSSYTKTYSRRKSTSKQFGLISLYNNEFSLTSTGTSLLDENKSYDERQELLKHAFYTSSLYGMLATKYSSRIIPSPIQLRNILEKEFHITEKASNKVAKCFIDNASYIGLLDQKTYMLGKEEKKSPQTIPSINSIKFKEGYMFKIPMLNKKQAFLFIPEGVNNKDIDYIKLLLDTVVPTFLDNLRNKIVDERETNTDEEC